MADNPLNMNAYLEDEFGVDNAQMRNKPLQEHVIGKTRQTAHNETENTEHIVKNQNLLTLLVQHNVCLSRNETIPLLHPS